LDVFAVTQTAASTENFAGRGDSLNLNQIPANRNGISGIAACRMKLRALEGLAGNNSLKGIFPPGGLGEIPSPTNISKENKKRILIPLEVIS